MVLTNPSKGKVMIPLPDPRRLWNDGSALEVHGTVVTRLAPGPGPIVAGESEGGAVELAGGISETTLVRLDVPLGGAVGYWHPACGWDRHLAADWMTGWRAVGLADSAPLGCLYDADGNAMLAFATDRVVATTLVKSGVGERTGRFGVWLAMDLEPGEVCRIRIAEPGRSHADALRELARWQAPGTPLPVPDAGRTATYSTWYSYHQEVSAAAIEAEAKLAAESGCGLLILDDGWQRGGTGGGYAGCGDWEPEPEKFPDFGTHVAAVHETGLKYMAWIAPLLLGQDSAAREELAGFAPHARPEWRCHVLDPRHARVREFVVDSCARLVEAYGLDGLKIDFLDSASAYASGTYAGAGNTSGSADEDWIPDVGTAMRVMLAALRDRLHAARGTDFLIEFRQPYTGPAILAYANVLRASDCPADAVANRVKSLDLALLAPDAAIHSDMLMWDASATPEQAARQLLAVLHTVPQISVRLADLPAEHRAMIAFWLGFWRERRDLLTGGRLRAGRPDELYPVVTAADAERAVAVLHSAQHLVPLDLHHLQELGGLREAAVVNATATGRVVLDLPHQADVRLTVSDACGRPVRTENTRLALGPVSVAVPPSGLCLITPVA